MADFFRRTEGEAFNARGDFLVALGDATTVQIDLYPKHASGPHGEDYARFRRAMGRATPKDDVDRKVLAALSYAPVNLGFVGDALLYATCFRFMKTSEKQVIWRLVRGGALVVLYTCCPRTYWLVESKEAHRVAAKVGAS